MAPQEEDRVALAHDYLLVMRGAERTFAAMCDMWPGAPVATLLHDPDVFGRRLSGHPIRTSPLQALGARQRTYKVLLPLLPAAAGRLEVGGADLVVSSSSAFAHAVRPDEGATHVCYCHSVFRYAWFEREQGVLQAPRPLRPAVAATLAAVRRWDRRVAQRPTHYVANSAITRARIAEFWGRDAPVLHPPVEVERFTPGTPEDWFLVVGELLRHKRVELALRAARRAGARVKVVGTGADEPRLRALHSGHAEFLGRVGDAELERLYASARALVMANTEEFGITAVESQAAGRPVVAAAAGGARETILDGVTGVLVPPGDEDALTQALRDTDFDRFDPAAAVRSAQRFAPEAFRTGLAAQIAAARG